MNTYLKTFSAALLAFFFLLVGHVEVVAQATVSYPFAIGRNSVCGTSGSHELHYYTYNSGTNTIANATGGMVNPCIPQLRIGGAANGTQRFTSSYASLSYNPADKNIYYFWTATSGTLAPGGIPRTYAWRWPIGTCASTATIKLDTLRSFAADILGVAFDNSGNGYMIEFTNALPTTPPTYKPLIRSINFTTGALGAVDTLALTGGAKIYQQGSGDLAISPSGQMFFVLDNKLFTPNYKSYTGTGKNLTCTYVDTVIHSETGYFVGLTYAEGQTVAAFSGGGCPFYEITPLTAAIDEATKSGTVYSASDMASVISGIGVAKNLVSITPTATAKQYTVEYDVYVKNYGNYGLTSVQVTDDLTLINGAANVAGVSAAFISNPAALVLNTGFNGNSNKNLLNGTGTLPNYPVSNNIAVIRITCTLSNIDQGKVYYNFASATAKGFNNVTVTDLSTNGTTADLNGNDKPDDVGEDQKTPLLIAVTPQTPPCNTLGQVFYKEDFGTGATAAIFPASPGGTTTYTGSTAQPLAVDRFMLATNANAGDNSKFISLSDHTGDGRMMIVNADATNKVFYSGMLGSLCANQQYSLSFYAAFIGNPNYQTICDGFGGFKYPKVKMRVKDGITGLVITEISTADITVTSWNLYGMKWMMPAGYNNIVFELINDGQGGCGNDIALDDIQFGTCDAAPIVSVSGSSAGCLGSSTTMSSSLSDANVIPGTKEYQWQISADNATFTNITAATGESFTIGSVASTDINKYYRVIVAAAGNMGTPSCQYTSPGFLLAAKTLSTAPTIITKNKTVLCPGDFVMLRASGATLGANAVYRWYTGACGGTPIGTGATITVNPVVSTTYYVRVEGDCNTTTCISTTITFNCDLDADDDGIPDVTESNGVDPKMDDDFDGVPNWKDAQYAGFTDVNGDGVNDNFDSDLDGVPNFLDRDSDNDGIPDVVESGGGDADGNGIIDGFSDADNDGLSDNVDANLSGHLNSGAGLGLLDTDSDGVPNYFDLDSDNDGIPDVVEVYGLDANNDGMLDFTGTFAANDSDGDGLINSVDGDDDGNGSIENTAGPLLKTGAVLTNGRAAGYPNKNMDADSKPNPYDLDSDGDGIADVIEAQFLDANYNGIIDGSFNARGWSTTISAMVLFNLPNTDNSGRPNVYDIDSDDDGIPDNVEGMATNSYKLPAGTDADGDGIDDAYDNINGFGGKGITAFNMDGDAFPDYIDTDTDGDGQDDRIEGNDFNLNKIADDDVALTGVDTDGDGLDDKFDADNTSAKATSAYMGNAGSFIGAGAPGSRTMVQKSQPQYTDRDWRQIEYVLNLNFLSVRAAFVQNNVQVKWTVLCYDTIQRYTVERSAGGVHFTEVATVLGSTQTNTSLTYLVTDSSAVNTPKLYYRIKAVGANGKYTYSSIAVAENRGKGQALQMMSNPVERYVQVRLTAAAGAQAQLYLYDAVGNRVAAYTKRVEKGYNLFGFPAAEGLKNGHYILKAHVNNEVLTAKFLIQK